jgi:hypothetical protein
MYAEAGINCVASQNRNKTQFVGFDVLTAAVMKSSVFWDITDISEERVASMFRQEASMKQVGSRACRLHILGP